MVRSLMDVFHCRPPMDGHQRWDPTGIHGPPWPPGWPPGALRTDHLRAARFAGDGGHGPWRPWVHGLAMLGIPDQCQVGKWPWPSVD